MSWKCPHCEEEIETLDYSVPTSQTEYGTAYINDKEKATPTEQNPDPYYERIVDHESGDNSDVEWDGSPEYSCPRCQRSINEDELIWFEDENTQKEKKKETEPEESLHKIIKPENYIIKDEISKDFSESSIVCKNCFHMFVFETENSYSRNIEEIYNCPKCNEQNSLKEFRILLEKGFFNTKTKTKNVTKKTTNKPIWSLDQLTRKIHTKISGYL